MYFDLATSICEKRQYQPQDGRNEGSEGNECRNRVLDQFQREVEEELQSADRVLSDVCGRMTERNFRTTGNVENMPWNEDQPQHSTGACYQGTRQHSMREPTQPRAQRYPEDSSTRRMSPARPPDEIGPNFHGSTPTSSNPASFRERSAYGCRGFPERYNQNLDEVEQRPPSRAASPQYRRPMSSRNEQFAADEPPCGACGSRSRAAYDDDPMNSECYRNDPFYESTVYYGLPPMVGNSISPIRDQESSRANPSPARPNSRSYSRNPDSFEQQNFSPNSLEAQKFSSDSCEGEDSVPVILETEDFSPNTPEPPRPPPNSAKRNRTPYRPVPMTPSDCGQPNQDLGGATFSIKTQKKPVPSIYLTAAMASDNISTIPGNFEGENYPPDSPEPPRPPPNSAKRNRTPYRPVPMTPSDCEEPNQDLGGATFSIKTQKKPVPSIYLTAAMANDNISTIPGNFEGENYPPDGPEPPRPPPNSLKKNRSPYRPLPMTPADCEEPNQDLGGATFSIKTYKKPGPSIYLNAAMTHDISAQPGPSGYGPYTQTKKTYRTPGPEENPQEAMMQEAQLTVTKKAAPPPCKRLLDFTKAADFGSKCGADRSRTIPKKPILGNDEIKSLIESENEDTDFAWILTSDQKKTYKKPCPKQQKAQMTVKRIVQASRKTVCEQGEKDVSPLLDPEPEDLSPEVAAAMMFAQEQGIRLDSCPDETVQHLFPSDEPQKGTRVSKVSIGDQNQKDKAEMIEKSASVPSEGVSDSAYTRTMKQKGDEVPSQKSYDLDFALGQEKREVVLVPQKPKRFNTIQFRGNVAPWFPGFFSAFPDQPDPITIVSSPSKLFLKAWIMTNPRNMPASDITIIE